jgi:trehalose 6-phosphate phosphatase
MKQILAPRHVGRLRALASGGALLGFDFDGTLAPFSGLHPDGAQLRPETAELLRSLAHAAPVAVITGRSVADASARLAGIPLLAVVGNHGAEPSPYAARAIKAVERWLPQVEALVQSLPGVVIENKRLSLSIHVAQAADPARATKRLVALAAELPGDVHAVVGTDLVNLVAAGAPTKGDALLALQKQHGFGSALFVGDELTDETAFRAIDPNAGFGVRVHAWRGSAAPYYIPSQLDIDTLLAELLAGRTGPKLRVHRTSAQAAESAPLTA